MQQYLKFLVYGFKLLLRLREASTLRSSVYVIVVLSQSLA